jgi:poly-gamma-glutamate capsule biosynthesis protein CapA/YwtB (metallophosphatase superfamily)
MIDAGADLVVGHGPHVPRAMEIYKERLIAYSLGNFATHLVINVDGIRGLAPLLLVDLAADGRVVGGEIVSFQQIKGKPPVFDPDGKAARLMFKLGEQDFPRSNALKDDGRI